VDQNQRRARIINMRKTPPTPRVRTARVPDTVLADLDAIDAATDNPTIHAATTRIRTALKGNDRDPLVTRNPADGEETQR
jgi:hypothetical protein